MNFPAPMEASKLIGILGSWDKTQVFLKSEIEEWRRETLDLLKRVRDNHPDIKGASHEKFHRNLIVRLICDEIIMRLQPEPEENPRCPMCKREFNPVYSEKDEYEWTRCHLPCGCAIDYSISKRISMLSHICQKHEKLT